MSGAPEQTCVCHPRRFRERWLDLWKCFERGVARLDDRNRRDRVSAAADRRTGKRAVRLGARSAHNPLWKGYRRRRTTCGCRMNPSTARPIFREEASRRYSESRVEQVLPRLAAPPVFRFLWVIAAILVAGLAAAGWTEIPVYVSAPAI